VSTSREGQIRPLPEVTSDAYTQLAFELLDAEPTGCAKNLAWSGEQDEIEVNTPLGWDEVNERLYPFFLNGRTQPLRRLVLVLGVIVLVLGVARVIEMGLIEHAVSTPSVTTTVTAPSPITSVVPSPPPPPPSVPQRPLGPAPAGKTWDYTTGQWVPAPPTVTATKTPEPPQTQQATVPTAGTSCSPSGERWVGADGQYRICDNGVWEAQGGYVEGYPPPSPEGLLGHPCSNPGEHHWSGMDGDLVCYDGIWQ
jgi:hypothetical protein